MAAARVEAGTPPFARDWLAEWTAGGLRLPQTKDPLLPVRVRKAADEVVRLLGDRIPKAPPTYEIEETVRRLASVWKSSGALRDVELRHLRRAPWAFFFPDDRPKGWLGSNDELVRAWLQWLASHRRSTTVVAILRAFLSAYPVDVPAFELIRQALHRQLTSIESPRIVRWRERCERFGLLDPNGPTRLVQHWSDVEVDFDSYLAATGLTPGLERSAFVRRSSEQLLSTIGLALRRGVCSLASCQRAFAWLEREGKLRFPELTVVVATTFLGPFVDKAPPVQIKEAIQAFLCRVVGDPRVSRHRWHGVPDGIRNVLFRWLVGASLEDFFHVLDQTALDKHWRYRKAFWTAYLEREVIDDAWVVLGPEAARIMRRGFDAGAAKLVRGYGVEANHSVLLMRIKGMTIAEWSHNGSCRMWTRGSKAAPKVYEAEYTRSELTDGCNFRQTHHGAEAGRWQEYVAALIESETGIRMSSASYMPKARRGR